MFWLITYTILGLLCLLGMCCCTLHDVYEAYIKNPQKTFTQHFEEIFDDTSLALCMFIMVIVILFWPLLLLWALGSISKDYLFAKLEQHAKNKHPENFL